MGLSWQQGPLAPGTIGRFLVPQPLPERMLFAEPLRRRMRVKFGGACIAGLPSHASMLKGRVAFGWRARLRLEPGQTVIPHGVDRDLATGEIAPRPS
jgi:hypothetical protein